MKRDKVFGIVADTFFLLKSRFRLVCLVKTGEEFTIKFDKILVFFKFTFQTICFIFVKSFNAKKIDMISHDKQLTFVLYSQIDSHVIRIIPIPSLWSAANVCFFQFS